MYTDIEYYRLLLNVTISSGAQLNDVNACIVLLGTQHSVSRMCLKSWHLLQLITNLSFVCFVCLNLSSNIISCNFIYNSNMILKSWELYCACPFSGNKQCIHIVSFPARCTCSHRSAGLAMICSFCQTHCAVDRVAQFILSNSHQMGVFYLCIAMMSSSSDQASLLSVHREGGWVGVSTVAASAPQRGPHGVSSPLSLHLHLHGTSTTTGEDAAAPTE